MTQYNCYKQEVWTTARRIRNGWAYRGQDNPKIPNDMLIDLKDKRLKCLRYDITRGMFIPTRCSYRTTELCVYKAEGNLTSVSSLASTTVPNMGPCEGVPTPGKFHFISKEPILTTH